jgi:LmbE family N-acetylglucosaminyl deacetylase
MRESELQAAAAALGIQHLAFLDYLDGELDQAEPAAAIAKIAAQIRRFRPDVVVTFGPDGAYGHPDHIAISQLTTAAVVHAAAPNGGDEPPHRVSKLYFRVWTPHEQGIYRAAFGDVSITVNDERRRWVGWPEWSISARLDTRPYWREVWSAVSCHQSQLPPTGPLLRLTEQEHEELWGTHHFYRAMSVVNGTHGIEDDLFAGLTSSQP